MKMISLSLFAILACGAAGAAVAAPPVQPVSLVQDPLVMRVNKDEFRIAFGINGERCGDNGCSGVIHYRVDWKTEDGALQTATRRVSYTVPPSARRTIAVDRQYFDTAEGRQTTDIVKVSVESITGPARTNIPRTTRPLRPVPAL